MSYHMHANNRADGTMMWAIWKTFLFIPLGWSSYMAGHIFLGGVSVFSMSVRRFGCLLRRTRPHAQGNELIHTHSASSFCCVQGGRLMRKVSRKVLNALKKKAFDLSVYIRKAGFYDLSYSKSHRTTPSVCLS